MNDTRFLVLLHRYMFYSWLFRDVNRGNLFEQHAAWQHNVDASRWLPLYLMRWMVFAGILLCLGGAVEMGAGAPVASTFFYVPFALSLTICAKIVACIASLRFMRLYAEPQAGRPGRRGGTEPHGRL